MEDEGGSGANPLTSVGLERALILKLESIIHRPCQFIWMVQVELVSDWPRDYVAHHIITGSASAPLERNLVYGIIHWHMQDSMLPECYGELNDEIR